MIPPGISRCSRCATPAIVKEFSHERWVMLAESSTYVRFRRIPCCLGGRADYFSSKRTKSSFLLLEVRTASQYGQSTMTLSLRTKDILFGRVMITEYPLSVVFSICAAICGVFTDLDRASHS